MRDTTDYFLIANGNHIRVTNTHEILLILFLFKAKLLLLQ
jgi:hypothetical protein